MIQEAVDNDSNYKNMSKASQSEAITELSNHRLLQTTAARTTNRSAARDVDTVMTEVEREVRGFLSCL